MPTLDDAVKTNLFAAPPSPRFHNLYIEVVVYEPIGGKMTLRCKNCDFTSDELWNIEVDDELCPDTSTKAD